jgi:hypothetical protein
VAILQISQIKHRRGYANSLPQLGSAELGWSIDTQQLYIGNGTLAEGAPEIGNTEILTEHSNIPGITQYTQTITNNTTANIANLIFDSTDPSVVINYSAFRPHTDGTNANVKTGTLTISQYLMRNNYNDSNVELGNTLFQFVVTQTANLCYVAGNVQSQTGDPDCVLTYTINTF